MRLSSAPAMALLRYQDMPTLRAIVRRAAARGNTFESLQGVVASPAFRMKEVSTPKTQTAFIGPDQQM